MGLLRRQVVTAALTANALRPLPSFRTSVPTFFAAWLTSELAPQLLAATAVDAGRGVRALRRGGLDAGARRRTAAGLALAGASAAGLGLMVRQAVQAGDVLEEALVEGLGADYVEQLDAAPTPADLAVPWRQLARPFSPGDRRSGVRVERDVAYVDGGRRGMLDLYLPPERDGRPVEGAPVLVQVHGGGWTIGKKEEQGLWLMHHLAAKGWVCVAVNYRLAPKHPWPAQIVDVKRALAWVKEHVAAYGGDPSYVAITGGSAGGHLASLAALTPGDPEFQPGFEDADTSVQVAVPHYGVYDFAGSTGLRSAELMRDRFLAPRVVRRRWRDAPHVFEAASPILRITPDAPDFFVVHGEHDSLVGVDQARLFVDRLRAVSSRTVVYAELPGTQHAFDVFFSIRSAHVVRAVDRYLHAHWNGWRHGRSPVEETRARD